MKEVRCTGHVRHPGTIPGILGSFWDTMCRLNSRQVRATTRMQPDFQAFLGRSCPGHIRARQGQCLVFRPCPGCIMAKAGTEPNFQAILGSFMDTVCRPCPGYGKDASRLLGIFRQFLEHDVQAMSGTRLIHDGDAAQFSGSF
ncbi:Hypothetical predicted protein [Olea europaea subsp. europaea]|uniref:Uncharacterized protein n=1 Tax=Olea europaea subsp. europaea TaxID=158383 RepID=A0A8S0T5A9_OLEEU|nr:Hypothetical predicted protein [Olea europaea subsp. europaea]